MWRNRLILLSGILASGILVGSYGGPAAYLLFDALLLLPLCSLVYVIYVYFRFCIYQKLEHRTAVKGERIPYTFRLSNEDRIPYFSVSVDFLKENSTVENVDMAKRYCLAPAEEIVKSTALTCHYRGEYQVGISHVRVMDCFCLFSITYPIQTKIEMKVHPRILEMSDFAYAPSHMDEKDRRSRPGSRQEILDAQIRSYQPGDSTRLIHWKASAAGGKLLCRAYTEESRNIVCLAADFSPLGGDAGERLCLEDKILEALLSVIQYFWRSRTRVRLFYAEKAASVIDLETYGDTEAFYSFCCEMTYQSELSFSELLSASALQIPDSSHLMLFTAALSETLFRQLKLLQGNGVLAIIFYMKRREEANRDLEALFAEDFCLVPIPYDQEPVPVLEGRENL